jgi:hypothetical protein
MEIVDTAGRQWFTTRPTTDKLDRAFEAIADEDGEVEQVEYVGGRDWVVFWSKAVPR